MTVTCKLSHNALLASEFLFCGLVYYVPHCLVKIAPGSTCRSVALDPAGSAVPAGRVAGIGVVSACPIGGINAVLGTGNRGVGQGYCGGAGSSRGYDEPATDGRRWLPVITAAGLRRSNDHSQAATAVALRWRRHDRVSAAASTSGRCSGPANAGRAGIERTIARAGHAHQAKCNRARVSRPLNRCQTATSEDRRRKRSRRTTPAASFRHRQGGDPGQTASERGRRTAPPRSAACAAAAGPADLNRPPRHRRASPAPHPRCGSPAPCRTARSAPRCPDAVPCELQHSGPGASTRPASVPRRFCTARCQTSASASGAPGGRQAQPPVVQFHDARRIVPAQRHVH